MGHPKRTAVLCISLTSNTNAWVREHPGSPTPTGLLWRWLHYSGTSLPPPVPGDPEHLYQFFTAHTQPPDVCLGPVSTVSQIYILIASLPAHLSSLNPQNLFPFVLDAGGPEMAHSDPPLLGVSPNLEYPCPLKGGLDLVTHFEQRECDRSDGLSPLRFGSKDWLPSPCSQFCCGQPAAVL